MIGIGCAGAAGAALLGLQDGGHSGRVGLPTNILRVGKFVVFFVLHSSVLEPNFDLSF